MCGLAVCFGEDQLEWQNWEKALMFLGLIEEAEEEEEYIEEKVTGCGRKEEQL